MRFIKSLSLIPIAFGSFLSVSANENNFEEFKFDQVENKQDIYEPKDKLDEYIIKGVTYSTKFVPLINDGAKGSEYTDIMSNDFKRLLVDAGFDFANSKANDEEGDLKTLAFSQARFATATDAEGSTINLGLGIRNRPNDISMIGANAFWDYRMTDYSDAHSRLGLGGEYLWKDFEFRNNFYMAITDEKDVTVKGTSYKERVVPGWDVELGYRLPNNPELAFFVRGFNWDYKNTQDNSGLEGSVSWQATPHIGLEAWVSNEISAASTTVNTSLPGTDETFFGLRMNITGSPVKFEKSNYKKNMITQMTQPVKRKYDVLLERSSGSFTNRAKGS